MYPPPHCPDCDVGLSSPLSRRQFVRTVGAAASAASLTPALYADQPGAKTKQPESLVKTLYDSLSTEQRASVCFEWDHLRDGAPLRSLVQANWHITDELLGGDFFKSDQKELIEAIFFGLYQPDWKDRIKKQQQDDAGGFGTDQSIAIFGKPGSGKFEFVMTSRHLTIRCDGDSNDHVAFGGPIFYGHAASSFTEAADHPGNVFWFQAQLANKLYEMLDGRQRKLALVREAPRESNVHFRREGEAFPGIRVGDLTRDQQEHVQKVLAALIEPYRTTDRDEVALCLKTQGGLEKCNIAFYQSGDTGEDGVWDIWRLEGPAFVWHFRGSPHVHTWVNVASDPSVKISTG